MSETIIMASGPDAYRPHKGIANFHLEYTKWVDVFTKEEVGSMIMQAMSANDPAIREAWLAAAKEWCTDKETA